MKKLGTVALAGACWLGLAGVAGAGPAGVQVADGVLTVRADGGAGVSVTVTGPEGFALSRTFAPGEAPALNLAEGRGRLADGLYLYDVRVAPAAGRQRGAEEGSEAALSGASAISGGFTVKGGSLERPTRAVESGGRAPAPPQPDDFLINDDLIVVGSGCLGFDCINNEPFGLENVLLKQNNNRIRADDTSASAGFPANDWQIRFNDDNSGGLNRFAVEDLTAARIPFSIVAGAPNNSIFVDSSGRLGVRTGAPAQTIHAVTGDTPSLRLEQDGSSGFSPQTWDVSGNESNFFIRDVTGGSTLPFKLRPGAPSSSVDILGTSGNVGIGTGSAAASLHVFRNNATAQLRVEEATATTGSRNMLRIVNNGASTFRFDNTFSGSIWGFGSLGTGNFFIGNTPGQPLAMQVTPAGNMIITGTYSSSSDRAAKDDVNAVDPAEVLAKVAELPIATWRYKGDDATHVGPMAQDFYAAFGLGVDDKHIAPTDLAGLGLAAIQALKAEVADKDARIRALEERLAKLEAAQKP
jgi:hypothetical protein